MIELFPVVAGAAGIVALQVAAICRAQMERTKQMAGRIRPAAPGVFVGAGDSGQPVYRMPDGRYSYGAQPDPNYVNALGGRRLTANWVDADEAARKGRVSLVVYDSAIGQPPPTVPPGATIPLTVEEWSIADARRIVFGERGIERVRTGPPCPSCSVHTVPGGEPLREGGLKRRAFL